MSKYIVPVLGMLEFAAAKAYRYADEIGVVDSSDFLYSYFMDIGGHGGMSAALSSVLYIAFQGYAKNSYLNAAGSMSASAGFVSLYEAKQEILENAGSIDDLIANGVGAILGAGSILLSEKLHFGKKSLKSDISSPSV